MIDHLPALQIVVPLLAAPLCVFIRHPVAVKIWAILVSWTTLAISAQLLANATASPEPISYWMGGWAPPWGIELRIDAANAYVMLLISAIASVVLLFGAGSAHLSVAKHRMYLFYAAFLLCMTGLLGITITGDAFNVFVFLETTIHLYADRLRQGTTGPDGSVFISDSRNHWWHLHSAASA